MSKRVSIGWTMSLALFVALVIQASTGVELNKPGIGQPAPDFTLKDLNGQQHSLEDYRGKVVIVSFISTECPVVNAYLERIKAIAADYKARNVVFLGINSNSAEPMSAMREQAAKNNLTFTILKDEGNRVADAYGASFTPEVYLIDVAGRLRYHGRIDNAPEVRRVTRHDLRQALDELLAGKAVSTPETKAFGCVIKRAGEATLQATIPANLVQDQPRVLLLKPAEFTRLTQQAKGQVLVINFWATWCGPCVVEFPEFVSLDEKYRDKGVRVVAISADDPSEINSAVIPFIKQMKARFEVYVQDVEDPQEMIDVVNKDWPGTLPATFIFDRQSKMVFQHFGIVDREKLITAVESALKS